jgi:hypothetical protein
VSLFENALRELQINSRMVAIPCPTAENVTSLPIEEIHELLPNLKELLAVP